MYTLPMNDIDLERLYMQYEKPPGRIQGARRKVLENLSREAQKKSTFKDNINEGGINVK